MATIHYVPDRESVPETIQEIGKLIAQGESVTRVEMWQEDDDDDFEANVWAVSYIDDGLCQIGYFRVSTDGESSSLIGDWQ